MVKKETHIRMVRKNFGRSGSLGYLLFFAVFFLLVILCAFLDFKNGLATAEIILLIFVVRKIFPSHYLLWATVAGLLSLLTLSRVLNTDITIMILNVLCFASVVGFLSSNTEFNYDEEYNVFFADDIQLECLAIYSEETYKGDALNPKSYRNSYNTNEQGFTKKETQAIIDLGQPYFPYFVVDQARYRANGSREDACNLQKILVYSPVIILSLLIYLFADNRDKRSVTCISLGLTAIVPLLFHFT